MSSDEHSEAALATPRRRATAALIARVAVVGIPGAVIAFLALRSSSYVQFLWWMPHRLGIWADHHGVMRNAVAFFAFALLVFVVLDESWRWILAVAVFAIALEVAQLGIRGRVFDWRDIVVSVAGILLAWPLAWMVNRARR